MIKIFPIIYPDVLGPRQHSALYQRLTGNQFPWLFSRTSAFKDDLEGVPKIENDASFSMTYHSAEECTFASFIFACVLSMFDKACIDCEEIFRLRIGLIPRAGREIVHLPHTDEHQHHKTALYCVSGKSGDTVFYNERAEFTGIEGDNTMPPRPSKFTIQQRITPKPNQLVVFDGSIYHSSSTPTDDEPRVMLNVNFV